MSKKRVEIKGWHEITIEMVNKDANCSLEVLTQYPWQVVKVLADPDVLALSWESGSRQFLVMTSQIARVIVESLEPEQLDDHERKELLATAVPTTRSVRYRTRNKVDLGYGELHWLPIWEDEVKP